MAQEVMTLNAAAREAGSKGMARQVRRDGMIPGVVYGNGTEGVCVQVAPRELKTVLKTEYGFNRVFQLDVEGVGARQCMLREWQFDSVRREMTHCDFLVVSDDQYVTIHVPVEPTGKSAGVAMGGRLDIVSRTVKVRCKVKDIPAKVEHDVTSLNIGESAYIDEMTAPEGCEFVFSHRYPVIRIARKRGAKVATAEATK